jgi:hypothetical protein
MDAEILIASAKGLSDRMYMDGHPEDRLAYRVGLLEARLREICYLYQNTADELRNVRRELDFKE